MAKSEHHRLHAQDRVRHRRLRIAQEAARLMSEHGIRDFRHAKRKAAQRLGGQEAQALPRNFEIEQALREHQRLFQTTSQPRQLRRLREIAAEAMDFLAAFQPRLVGRVLDGSADAHTAIHLQVFADDPEALALFLHEHDVPLQWQSRRLRWQREVCANYPLALFSADGTAFELTVLPMLALRQAPLDPVDEKPMRRASLSTLRALLALEDAPAPLERRASALKR